MSHFTVLVAATDQKDLEAKLQPYHEYECTGINDQYVIWVDDIHDENHADWQKNNCGYESFKSYMEDYCGYTNIDPVTGRYGRLTNPNAKWDWWVIGGRWSNSLLLKDGSKANSGIASEIDWESIKNQQGRDFIQKTADFQKAFNKASAEDFGEDGLERFNQWFPSSKIAQSLTGGDPNLAKRCLVAERYLRRGDYGWIKFHEWSCVLSDFSHELDKAKNRPLTFAFVDQSGQWVQTGQMGWWAVVSDKQEDYPDKFWSFTGGLQPDQKVYVVDCHI